MHLADGILSAPVLAGTGAASAIGVAIGLRRMATDDIPRAGMLSAVFFVASFVHVNIGPVSAHLVLNGLLGIVLGWRAFPAITAALLLQSIFFGYGGLTALGANILNMALPASLAGMAFRQWQRQTGKALFAAGALCGAAAIAGSAVLMGLCMLGSDRAFAATVAAVLIAHLPILIIEGMLSGFMVHFIHRVKPELLTS